MKRLDRAPDRFWKGLEKLLIEHTGVVANLILEEILTEMGKESLQDINLTEVPAFLDRLFSELEKILSPAFFKRFKKKAIDLFNQTFTSL